jgi:hypothetical protein
VRRPLGLRHGSRPQAAAVPGQAPTRRGPPRGALTDGPSPPIVTPSSRRRRGGSR